MVVVDYTPEVPRFECPKFVFTHDLRELFQIGTAVVQGEPPRLFCRIICDLCQARTGNLKRTKFQWPWAEQCYENGRGRWTRGGTLMAEKYRPIERALCQKCFKNLRSLHRSAWASSENTALVKQAERTLSNANKNHHDRAAQNISV